MFKWFNKFKKTAEINESNRICPVCVERMDKVVKGDIIIDVCPKCNGVWLDDKEIDKLVSYAKNENAPVVGNNLQKVNEGTQKQTVSETVSDVKKTNAKLKSKPLKKKSKK